MFDKLSKLFGDYKEAIVAVKDGEIKYFNGTAAQMIPDIQLLKPEDIFPLRLISPEITAYSEEAQIKGYRAVVTVNVLDDCRIYSIVAPDFEEQLVAGNLLSALSIELRNSLSVLKMASGLLLPYVENIGDERLSRYSSMIYHCYYNMLRVTNNISDLSSFLREESPLIFSSFDIISASRNMMDSIEHLVGQRGITFRFKTNENSLMVYADKAKIGKLLLNLLSNSLTNTPPGGVLAVSVVSAGDRFVITVSDTGGGIPDEVLTTAWNRYNVRKDLSKHDAGVGLGLTIVQNIAQLHGGSAVLESRPGEGTIVTVSIPIGTAETTADLQPDAAGGEFCDMQQLLTELSCNVNYENYTQRYMD